MIKIERKEYIGNVSFLETIYVLVANKVPWIAKELTFERQHLKKIKYTYNRITMQ